MFYTNVAQRGNTVFHLVKVISYRALLIKISDRTSMFRNSIFKGSRSFTNICKSTGTLKHVYIVSFTRDHTLYRKHFARTWMLKSFGLTCKITLLTITTFIVTRSHRREKRHTRRWRAGTVCPDQHVSKVRRSFKDNTRGVFKSSFQRGVGGDNMPVLVYNRGHATGKRRVRDGTGDSVVDSFLSRGE